MLAAQLMRLPTARLTQNAAHSDVVAAMPLAIHLERPPDCSVRPSYSGSAFATQLGLQLLLLVPVANRDLLATQRCSSMAWCIAKASIWTFPLLDSILACYLLLVSCAVVLVCHIAPADCVHDSMPPTVTTPA
jgi:hypothetical protein